jgi:hypothetical protein
MRIGPHAPCCAASAHPPRNRGNPRRDDLHACQPGYSSGRATVKQVTSLPPLGKAARARLAIAISLGVISILGGLLLAAADIIRGTATWPHHSPVSAAPLFFVAAAIAAVSIGRPTNARHGLLRLVAVLAFTAWGTAQVAPDPATAGALNDVAILLFVIDGGYAVVAEARAILARRKLPAQATPL